MPQIDFGRAFTAPEKAAPSASTSEDAPRDEPAQTALVADEPVKLATGSRLNRFTWRNIIFVALTLVGGLLCAFYFFNGNELLRAAEAWTGEFLYPRPAIITLSRDLDHSGEQASEPSMSVAGSADQGGDPFSRTSGLLTLAPPWTIGLAGAGAGLPRTANIPNAGSPLHQLGFPAPGGDALAQLFNRAVAELGRPSASDTGPTAP